MAKAVDSMCEEKIMHKEVAIIGSGIAGLSLAHELSCLGIGSAIIDRQAVAGGQAAGFACKATDSCQRCGACIVHDYVSKVTIDDMIEPLLSCHILDSSRTSAGFELLLNEVPARIDQAKCSGCGICKKVCPSPGAIRINPYTGSFFIEYSECLLALGFSCSVCEQACFDDAISISSESVPKKVEALAIAIATGFEPFDATIKKRFGYGRIPGVITSLDLENLFRSGYFQNMGSENSFSSIAFVQCVGSRDIKIGRNYCSRVCCGYAMRSARLLKFMFPSIKVTMFFMDLQTFDRDFEDRVMAASREVDLIRGIPSEIKLGASGKPEVVYNDNDDEVRVEEFDMVTLSVGMGPTTPHIGGYLGFIGANSGNYGDGSFGNPDPTTTGVFRAGSANGPRTIQESIEHAAHVACEIDRYLCKIKSGVDVE